MDKLTKLTKFRRYFATSTIDSIEIQHFQNLANQWWDQFGVMRALHSMNQIRIPFILNSLKNTNQQALNNTETCKPLLNITALDVGCGGGILCEPLARLGANVTGIDATADLITLARLHAEKQNIPLNYIETSVEDHAKEYHEKYDLVVASEIIEHVTQKKSFVEACVKCLKPNGSIIFTTFNKTMIAQFAAIFVAEYLSDAIPKGTHEFDKFIEPHKLQRLLEETNCRTHLIHGMLYNPLKNNWIVSSNISISYLLHAIKVATDE